MPRGKYSRKTKAVPGMSPVVDLAVRLADMDPAGRVLANEIAAKIVNERAKVAEIAPDPFPAPVLREVNVGGAVAEGKSKAKLAKRAIKRAGKKHQAEDTATPIQEKSSLAGFLGKGAKKAAPASD